MFDVDTLADQLRKATFCNVQLKTGMVRSNPTRGTHEGVLSVFSV
jgi:hypothetical protein